LAYYVLYAPTSNLLFKQRIGQLEALMFMRPGIEEHQRAGTETFDLTDIMLTKPAPLVQSARVCKNMSPACSIDMEANRLLADWTLCEKRMNSPPNQRLYELHNPHIEMSHG
jgi:hypothetical protein